jgi:histidyl-tRNA synthetase
MTALVGGKSAENLLENLYFGEGLLTMMHESEAGKRLNQVIEILRGEGISNLVFDPAVTGGFDYYTGIVFEVFDTNKENPRTIFGGGRYDDLVGSFTNQKVPAFGFGMGDVTTRDFLETHKLLPKINSTTDVYICIAPETPVGEVYKIAEKLRDEHIDTAVDISGRKLGDQLKSLDKRRIPFVTTIGSEELKNKTFTIRNTETREEKSGSIEEIVKIINAQNRL